MKIIQPFVRSISLRTRSGPVDLKNFKPPDPFKFDIALEVFIGINEYDEASERFDVSVCTPAAIVDELKNTSFVVGHGMLIINEYSYDLIVNTINRYVETCVGNTIDDVLRRIGLLGEWESEWEVRRK